VTFLVATVLASLALAPHAGAMNDTGGGSGTCGVFWIASGIFIVCG
jgi:hypothetical protein